MLSGIEVEVNFADGLVLPVIEVINEEIVINVRRVPAHATVEVDLTDEVEELISKDWLIVIE